MSGGGRENRLLLEMVGRRLTVLALAGALVDGAKVLNATTGPESSVGFGSVEEVAELLAELSSLLVALPQLLRQTAAYVDGAARGGVVGVRDLPSVDGMGPMSASLRLGDQVRVATSELVNARYAVDLAAVTAARLFEVSSDAFDDVPVEP